MTEDTQQTVNGTETTNDSEGQATENVNQDSGEDNSTPVDGTQGVDQSVNDNEGGQEEFVKGEDGKDYIPREAFEARIAKLTAQKHEGNEARSLLETIKNDPTARREFLDGLGLGKNSSDTSQEPTAFEQFLAPLPQEHQAHYRNMATALATEFESFVNGELEKRLKPVMSWIGESKVNSFRQNNKDYGRYEKAVEKIMSEGRAKDLEDAFKIASFEDKIKSVRSAGAKQEKERQIKIGRSPITGPDNAGGTSVRPHKGLGLREALLKASQEVGYVNGA